MRRVVVSGLGFITSIGNSKSEVLDSLRTARSGVELFDEFDEPGIPIKLAGTVKGFQFPTFEFEDWTYPSEYKIRREILRPMAPNSLYAFCAMQQAIEDAKLPAEKVTDEKTGLFCASGGSMWMSYSNLDTMLKRGVMRCQPMGMVNGIPGSLYINLVNAYKIRGASLGFSSACSSSSHALGNAFDQIRWGRQEMAFVVGAEDCNKFSILPFAGIRALSPQTDPKLAPRAFDVKRDGFVGTGGATVLVLEPLESALARGATIYAEILGWGQATDGFDVVAPEPSGDGVRRSMLSALEDSGVAANDIDYLNAHATSTPPGDVAEIAAIKAVFNTGRVPNVSSTKSLTGHGLSLAGAMESGFSCLTISEGFTPISANITELDPACEGVPVVTQPIDDVPKKVMKNSSGFGGTNVSIVFSKLENAS